MREQNVLLTRIYIQFNYVIEQAAVNEQQNGQYFLPVLEASVHVTQQTVCIPICTALHLGKPPWFKCSIHQS